MALALGDRGLRLLKETLRHMEDAEAFWKVVESSLASGLPVGEEEMEEEEQGDGAEKGPKTMARRRRREGGG